MTARTHDVFAFACLITVAAIYPPTVLSIPTIFTSIVGNVIGSLAPDLDQASNRLWDLLPGGNLVGRVLRHAFIGHRTISHSLLGGYLLYRFLVWVLPVVFNESYVDINILLVSIMIGFVSHLIADGVTKEGIPLFFPLPFKVAFPPFRFLRVTTGSAVENWVVLPAVGGYILWFMQSKQEVFLQILMSSRRV